MEIKRVQYPAIVRTKRNFLSFWAAIGLVISPFFVWEAARFVPLSLALLIGVAGFVS
jgi:hypothetical protein